MDRKFKIWYWGLALLIPLLVLGNTAAQGVDELLAPYESGERDFTRSEIGDLIVYFHQRKVGDAIVEKDFIVYQFDKETKKLVKEIVNWRKDVREAVPPGKLISQKDAEALAEGEVLFSELYIISPESDVFLLDPTPTNPCWVVRSVVNGRQVVSIIDAVTGEFLGNGIAPPWEGFSLGGPNWGDTPPCDTYYYTPYATNARSHFNALGYPTYAADNPTDATVRAYIQSPSVVAFYELAHGDYTGFHNTCPDSAGDITPAMVKSWIASYRKMPFTFIGSCGGMCQTGSNTLSYEFRKGSSASATTVGYCNMSEDYCSSCWYTAAIPWQNSFFNYVKAGKTIKRSVELALSDNPQCLSAEHGHCMRFAGDAYFKLGSRDEIMGVGGTWSSGAWYRNLASQTWHKPYNYTPGAIAVGDVTGDGRADMVSCWGSGLWYQNGATNGWTKVYHKAPNRIACGDITGDGYDEIFACGGTWSSGMWYRNVRYNTWHKTYGYTASGEIAAGDITGDGRADMVSCWGSGLWYQNGATNGWTPVYHKAPNQVACGDITSDGRAEIVGYGGTWGPGIWYLNVRYGTWHKPYGHTPSGDLAVGDVTGDRYADMITCWGSGLWYQNGRTWGWTREYTKPPGRVAAGDISGN
jgi:hypothetical protein